MITQVEARYFRRLKHIAVTLGPGVTLVVGENGAGKTSLAAAIEFALTGSCRWTDRRGAGYKVLINHEAADVGSTIVLDTDFTGQVERQLSPEGMALGVDGREGSSAKALLSVNLPEPEILNAMLRSDGFTGLSPKEQQEVLFMLDGGRTGADWFRARLTAEEAEILEERLASKATGSALAEKLHDAAYAMRTLANKQAAAAQAKLDQYHRPPPVAGSTDPDVREQLAALREQQATLHEQIGAAVSWQLATTRARARQEAVREEIARLEAALADVGDVTVPTEMELTLAEARMVETRDTMPRTGAAMTAAETALDTRRHQLERFIELGTGCVLGNVECPMDASTRARIIEQEQMIVDEQEKALPAIRREYEDSVVAAGEAADALGVLHDRKAETEAIARETARLTEALEGAKKRFQETVTEAAEAGRADVEDLRRQSSDLAAKIAEMEQALTAAAQYRDGIAEYERLAQEAEFAIAKADMLNELVRKLAPDGLPAQAMGDVTSEVLGKINAVLAEFTDFQLTAEPGAHFLLSVMRDGFETPVFALSESEELRIGAAIQVALAAITGFGFVIVDAADRLDGRNRERLLKMLTGQSMVQALVLATPAAAMTDKQREALAGMGVKVVEIAGGQVVAEAA